MARDDGQGGRGDSEGGRRDGDRRVQTVCLMILTALALAGAMHLLRSVLVPFVLALFLAMALMPLVDLQMRRLRLPRFAAVIVALLVSVVVLAGFAVLVSYSVAEFARDPDAYRKPLAELTDKVFDALPLERLGIEREPSLREQLGITSESIGRLVLAATDAVAGGLSSAALVFILLCFMLFGGTGGGGRLSESWAEAVAQTRQYLVTKTGISLATGGLTWLVLWAFGVPMAMAFGLLAFLLNFIPSLGSIIATVLPMPVVLLTPGISAGEAVAVLAILAAVQITLGNVLEPRMMGKTANLHPITVMLALILWGILWGVVGTFLAVPVTAAMRIFLARSELTAPAARLMSGRLDAGQRSA